MLLCSLALVLVAGALSAGGTVCSNATCYQSSGLPQTPTAGEDRTIDEGRCFAVCADTIIENCEDCDDFFTVTQQLEVWTTLNASGGLVSNCSIYQQLQNCQRGCVIATHNSPEILEDCQIQCSRFCEEKCSNQIECDATYSNSNCKINCDDVDQSCRTGCEVALTMENAEERVPTIPVNSPSLDVVADSDKGGQYILDLVPTASNGSQTNLGPSQNNEISSFVIRIESNHSTSYIWQSKVNGSRLNLEYAACQTVNVSFAVVNKNGVSAGYSPASQICVKGETRYPEQLQNISFVYKEDFRFPRHTLANISWSRPRGYEYVERYSLGVLSTLGECGGLYAYKIYSIPKIETSYVVSSDTETELPFYNCTYTVLLRVIPQKRDAYPLVAHMTPTWTSPDMLILCSRELLQNSTMSVKVMWTLPLFPGLIEAVDHFEVTIILLDNSSQPTATVLEEYPRIVVSSQVNNRDYSAVISNLMPKNNSYLQYQIRVKAVQNSAFNWRRVPKTVMCHVDSGTESPSRVSPSLVSIDSLVLTKNQQQLMMEYSWSPPHTPNGVIDRYEVRITKGPAAMAPPSNSDIQTIYYKSINETGSMRDAISLHVTTAACLFLQIRSHNQFLWSNWSEPVALSESNQCSNEVVESTTTIVASLSVMSYIYSPELTSTNTPQPSQTPNAKVTKLSDIIFLVAPAVLVAVAISVLVMAILIIFKRRANKEKKWKAAMGTMYEERENY